MHGLRERVQEEATACSATAQHVLCMVQGGRRALGEGQSLVKAGKVLGPVLACMDGGGHAPSTHGHTRVKARGGALNAWASRRAVRGPLPSG